MLLFSPPELQARELRLRVHDPGRADDQLARLIAQALEDAGQLCPACAAPVPSPAALEAWCPACGHAWPVDETALEG